MPSRATISLFSGSSSIKSHLMTFFHVQCKEPGILVDEILNPAPLEGQGGFGHGVPG